MSFTPEEIYYKFLSKINKGSTEYNISCDRALFSSLINEAKHKWVKKSLVKDKDSILVEQLQELVKDKELLNPVVKTEYTEFDFADDYYETIGGYCNAKQGNCNTIIRLREVKNQDKQLLYFDESNQPSFEYEWSFFTLQNNKLRVYKKDFEVEKVSIEYYKILDDFDIIGYVKADGNPSQDKPLNLSDNKIDEIIDEAALEFSRIYENQLQFQLNKERITYN